MFLFLILFYRFNFPKISLMMCESQSKKISDYIDSQLTLMTQALRLQYCSIITYSKFYLRKATRGSWLYVPLTQKYIYKLVAWTQQAKLFKRQSVEVVTRSLPINPYNSSTYVTLFFITYLLLTLKTEIYNWLL